MKKEICQHDRYLITSIHVGLPALGRLQMHPPEAYQQTQPTPHDSESVQSSDQRMIKRKCAGVLGSATVKEVLVSIKPTLMFCDSRIFVVHSNTNVPIYVITRKDVTSKVWIDPAG